jgi:hypothetical protein
MRLHPAQLRTIAALAAGAVACLLAATLQTTSGQAAAAVSVPAGSVSAGSVSAAVNGVAFPTPSSGWAIGTTGSTGNGSAIWHTSTAGTTWQTQWQGSGKLLSVSATDPAHAWAILDCARSCGSELLATTDGGASWRVLAALPGQAAQVDFASARLGVVIVDGCLPGLDPGLSRCPGQVLVSGDGGARWTRVLSGAMPVFAVADAQGRLWAAEPVASGSVTFLTSTNNGRSWTRLSAARTMVQLSDEVQVTLVPDGGRLALASVFDVQNCAMHGCITDTLSSGNGGHTWQPVNLPDNYQDYCGPASLDLSVGQDGSVWIGSGRNGAACSPPLGLLYRLTSGGLTSGGLTSGGLTNGGTGTGWQELPPWQLSSVSALDPVNAQVAYAIGDEGLLARTDDGGQHWTQILSAPVPTGEVDVLSAGQAFGAQDGVDAGAILRSDSAGPDSIGWTEVGAVPGVITQLDFPSPTHGVVVTDEPSSAVGYRLWTSTDGGASWTVGGALPRGQDLVGPWITADGHGLLLTEQGGDPWEPQAAGNDPVDAWVTSDWGASWTRAGTFPFGRATPDGPASFAYVNGTWTGWMAVFSASSDFQIDVATIGQHGVGRLSVLTGNPPSDGLQFLGPATGFAWTIDYSGRVPVLSLYRTTDDGRSWQRSAVTLSSNPSAPLPLLGFSSALDGWLVVGDTVLVTTDGGRTWSTP